MCIKVLIDLLLRNFTSVALFHCRRHNFRIKQVPFALSQLRDRAKAVNESIRILLKCRFCFRFNILIHHGNEENTKSLSVRF